MSGRVMHLERALGGVMCRLAGVPSRWQRTSDPAQMTCSRCRVVYLRAFTVDDLTDDWAVVVCDHCKQASCWLGIFMCYDSREAGTVMLTVRELRELGREHPDYWVKEARARVGVE